MRHLFNDGELTQLLDSSGQTFYLTIINKILTLKQLFNEGELTQLFDFVRVNSLCNDHK